jgi:putative tributyrin esterase
MPPETHEFPSSAISGTARLNVLVPRGGERRYPVLYLQHGLGGTYESFCTQSDLEVFAQELDLIVVMPHAGDGWFCNDPRPGGPAWEDHLAMEVVDFVDANFPTIAAREGRALAGFSMGGYGAMMLAMKHADRFAAVSAHAGSFAFGHAIRPDRPERTAFMQAVAPPGGQYDLWELAAKLAGRTPELAIRFDVGTDDHQLPYNRQFHARLEELKIGHEYEEVQGGHEWSYFNRQLPTTLKFVSQRLASDVKP